ncbi:hypothetical protein BSZ35_17595 [Salinibacter sp. 10B]|uniref:PKD domain-containing protein n=1 Tax=Salinibacter sp. 10B TaxID=1923971 RepID=UPI000CF4E4E1|nr:PKD domain-containing protein [Salinibacter sp. 10B]PQJ36172.1 hypothetical protein BSZ35_17595 [Salinibacter sp. 10B]
MQYLRALRLVAFGLLGGALLVVMGCDSAGSNSQGGQGGGSQNQPPSADVTVSSSTVDVGDQVNLDGTGSSDPDGDKLDFSWSLSTPSGSNASLSDASAEQPTFTPDVSGDYTATLEVSDGDATDSDDAAVTAQTVTVEISSSIESDRTLSPDNSYLVTSTICVQNSSTLTIEAGVTIEFESDTGLKVCGDGSALVAQGTSSNGILMTGTTNQAGFWQGIGINSSNNNNELSGVTLEYAGSNNLYTFVNGTGGLQLKSGSSITITNTTIRNNSNYGLTAQGNIDLSGFSSNTFADNEKMAMNINAGAMGAPDGASNFGSPVRVNGGSISGETLTVSALNVPYQISGTRQIEDGSDVTVEAGTVMEFESGAGLKIVGDPTAFKAQGSEAERVLMTGTTKQKGFWQGVGINSANKNNRLEHVTLEYAGSNNLFTFVNGTAGLQLKGGTSVTLVQDSIRNNANYGVSVQTGVDLSGFSSNVIMDNEKMSMNIAATNMGALDENSFFKTPVRVNAGSISDETLTIADLNVPYRISGVRPINNGSDVTVNPGATFEFESEAGLNVSDDATAFKAQGAKADSIRFTGVTEQSGSWQGLGIQADNVNNELSYVVVEYGGGNNIYTFSDDANIQLRGTLTLTNSRIVDSAGYGLASSDGASAVTESNNTYRRNNNGARNF